MNLVVRGFLVVAVQILILLVVVMVNVTRLLDLRGCLLLLRLESDLLLLHYAVLGEGKDIFDLLLTSMTTVSSDLELES